MKYLILSLLLFTVGCSETRSEKQTQVERDNDVQLTGNISLPIGDQVLPLPFNLTVKHMGTEQQNEVGKSESKINAAAIGQQLGDAAATALRTALTSATGIKLPTSSAWTGVTPTEGGLAGGVAAAAAWGLREMLERRRREKTLEEVKAARNEAQQKALELAKQLPPPQPAYVDRA